MRHKSSLRRGRNYLEQAIKLDPNYGRAWNCSGEHHRDEGRNGA